MDSLRGRWTRYLSRRRVHNLSGSEDPVGVASQPEEGYSLAEGQAVPAPRLDMGRAVPEDRLLQHPGCA